MADADAHLKDRLLNDLSSSIDVRQDEPLVEAPGARPAIPDHTLLRRIGKGSYGEVWLSRNGRRVNAKSIMGVMMLAAEHGSSITFRAEGPDADQALDALTALVGNKFGES